jgi:hypothetical protein
MNYKNIKTAHNRSVYASPPLAARATKNHSRPAAFVRFFLRHILSAPVFAAQSPNSGSKKRRIQQERYATRFATRYFY